jgi:glycosyltransferase involved in cell wall biosynthesis
MKVLWVTMNSNLFNAASSEDGYNGGGWISSLFKTIKEYAPNIKLGVTFLSNDNLTNKQEINGTIYYPIKRKKYSLLKKLYYYWGGYKSDTPNKYYIPLKQIIDDFQPDLIHLWGTENPLACISLISSKPVVVHIQGILSAYYENYYPYKMNKYSFYFNYITPQEWITHNGYNCAEKVMYYNAQKEKTYLQHIQYIMGRTHWDYQITRLLSPHSRYFHVDEILRDEFYSAKVWEKKKNNTLILLSTISETAYKGFDIIIRTSHILISLGINNFEWHVIGIKQDSDFAKIYFKQWNECKDALTKIKLLGTQTPKGIISELQNCDLYIHPSYIDNSPNSLCEAQILGVPTIATNTGGISSLISKEQYYNLIPTNSPLELAYAINEKIKDEERTKSDAANNRKIALIRHNKRAIVNTLIEVYNTIKINEK